MRNTRERHGRRPDELRPLIIERAAAPYAEGSCLIQAGQTRVLCTASVQDGLPDWRRGANAGWVTAEYSMLPRATHQRTRRERGQVGGRTQEIQRLIGRALRAATDLTLLGERTITIDCDVIVADAGTRTAAITGAAIALHDAGEWLRESGAIEQNPLRELVAAVSVGIIGDELRLDLDYNEDSNAETDMNIVAIESGGLVEVQGTAEGKSFSREQLDELIDLGIAGINSIFQIQRRALSV
jgi:ribonuclease PH